MSKKTVLLLTDFSYQAKGREYFREDVELSVLLRTHFNVLISHIKDSERAWPHVDAILIRNTGPQASHHEQLMSLKNRANLNLFNDLLGKGDLKGKQHLLDLYDSGFPVIPTFNSLERLTDCLYSERYLLKPLNGADSVGIQTATLKGLHQVSYQNHLIQPLMDFEHEVSFYFVGHQFQYALYAPNRKKRWDLKPFKPSKEDLDFAQSFISWNTCEFGIQRVDACRLKDGTLLLMELEDYNPFLSLDVLSQKTKAHFIESLCASLKVLMQKK